MKKKIIYSIVLVILLGIISYLVSSEIIGLSLTNFESYFIFFVVIMLIVVGIKYGLSGTDEEVVEDEISDHHPSYEVVNNRLKNLLEAHGLECSENDDWIIPNGEYPLISMTWYPNPDQDNGVLQVDVQIDQEHCMQECFAGIGAGEIGLDHGIRSFSENSLHVMLSALWGMIDEGQVSIEEWIINSKTYSLHIGPFGTKATNDNHPGIPKTAFTNIENVIKKLKINSDISWFRNFYGHIDDNSEVYESLYNNEMLLEGEESLKATPWLKSDSFYSVRNFIIAIEKK